MLPTPSWAARARWTARSICKSEERASWTKTRPASVSSTRTTRRLSRVNKRNLCFSSISVICLLSADWVRCNLRAAFVKFSSSAKTMTACKWRTSTLGNTANTPSGRGQTSSNFLPLINALHLVKEPAALERYQKELRRHGWEGLSGQGQGVVGSWHGDRLWPFVNWKWPENSPASTGSCE